MSCKTLLPTPLDSRSYSRHINLLNRVYPELGAVTLDSLIYTRIVDKCVVAQSLRGMIPLWSKQIWIWMY